jgi:hypothetical protein
MFDRPVVHRQEYRLKRLPERSQSILDPWRNLPEIAPFDETIGVHLSKLLGESPVGDSGKIALKLVESARPLQQPVNHHRLPAAGNHLESHFGWASELLGHRGIL